MPTVEYWSGMRRWTFQVCSNAEMGVDYVTYTMAV